MVWDRVDEYEMGMGVMRKDALGDTAYGVLMRVCRARRCMNFEFLKRSHVPKKYYLGSYVPS